MSEEKTTPTVEEKVVQLAEASRDDSQAARKAVEDLTASVETIKTDLKRQEEVAGRKFTEMREYLETKHGKSGADDWFATFGKWLAGAYHVHRSGDVPEHLRVDGIDYTKADVTTGTSGTSYLVPTLLSDAMFASKDIYGSIIPRCFRVTVPAGQQMNFNAEATNPSAYWRTGAANQGTALSEASMTWSQSSVVPTLVGATVTASNELLEIPGVNYAEKAANRMLRAIVRHEETGILQGDDDALGTKLDPPSDGWLTSTSGSTSTDAVAASTIAAYADWIADCIDNYEAAMDTGEMTIVLSPAKVMALAAQVVSGTNLPGALTWADPVSGIPGKLLGYDYIAHPKAKVSTSHYASMLNLSDVVYANSGKLSVDFNPWGASFTSNQTDIRVMTHTDWAFPNASNILVGAYT